MYILARRIIWHKVIVGSKPMLRVWWFLHNKSYRLVKYFLRIYRKMQLSWGWVICISEMLFFAIKETQSSSWFESGTVNFSPFGEIFFTFLQKNPVLMGLYKMHVRNVIFCNKIDTKLSLDRISCRMFFILHIDFCGLVLSKFCTWIYFSS